MILDYGSVEIMFSPESKYFIGAIRMRTLLLQKQRIGKIPLQFRENPFFVLKLIATFAM